MAAVAPYGFRPVRMLDGSPWNGALTMVAIPASNGTATFVGDVVNWFTDAGAAGLTSSGLNLEGTPQAVVSANGAIGQNLMGVVCGFLPDPTNLSLRHRAASTLRVALVCLADGVVFEAQEDGATSQLAAADMNLNISFNTTAGNTATGQSKFSLISNNKAATATLPCRLIGLSKRVGNAYASSATDVASWEVYFNTSQQKPNIVGVA
jgi:hypothetical protein